MKEDEEEDSAANLFRKQISASDYVTMKRHSTFCARIQ
jgi:hypothetical protein